MSEISDVLDVLVVTGGHPFEADPFFAVFDSFEDVRWRHATTPDPDAAVVVLYDMPGIRFTRADPPVELLEPDSDVRATFAALRAAGTGLVFLHHAVAGWPAWPEYAEMIGGRFHYVPGRLDGVEFPDSGYRFDVTHTIDVLEPDHPVCAGLGPSFELTDELYCFPVLEEGVVPLLRTRFDTSDVMRFSSAELAIRGERGSNRGWTHPAGSSLVGWVRAAERAPVVYLQFGDGPVTYADPSYRTVLHHAIRWAGSADARAWAAGRADEVNRATPPTPPSGSASSPAHGG